MASENNPNFENDGIEILSRLKRAHHQKEPQPNRKIRKKYRSYNSTKKADQKLAKGNSPKESVMKNMLQFLGEAKQHPHQFHLHMAHHHLKHGHKHLKSGNHEVAQHHLRMGHHHLVRHSEIVEPKK